MSNSIMGLAQTSDGKPIRLIDNGDGSYSIAVSLISNTSNTSMLQFSQTQSITVSSSTAETSLVGSGVGSPTIGSNLFGAGTILKLKANGFHSAAGNPTVTINIKIDGVTIMTTGAQSSNSSTNTVWGLEAILTCRTTGASGTVIGQGHYREENSTNLYGLPMTGTTTLDTTTSHVINITWAWGTASASNTVTCTNFTLELVS